MPKTTQTPSTVLSALMEEYQLNPFSLSKEISLSNSAVRLIANGKSRVTVPTALRLAKYFGQTPDYWLDLQRDSELNKAQKDNNLMAIISGISKAKKPSAKAKNDTKAVPTKKTVKAGSARAAKAKPSTRGRKAGNRSS